MANLKTLQSIPPHVTSQINSLKTMTKLKDVRKENPHAEKQQIKLNVLAKSRMENLRNDAKELARNKRDAELKRRAAEKASKSRGPK